MDSDSTRATLLSRLRDPDDDRAWREFDARYGSLVTGYCRSCGLQLSDAEDVRQVVMLQLARALPGFKYEPIRGRFRDYFRKVVRNAISRHVKRHTTGETGLDISAWAALSDPADDDSDARWESQWVRHHCRLALHELRMTADSRRVAIFDHLLAGHSIADTATAFQMTPAAVRKTKQRVKDWLQAQVAAQIRDEDSHA